MPSFLKRFILTILLFQGTTINPVNGYSVTSPLTGWYRFNTPAAGTPTTIGNTTVETQLVSIYPAHKIPTTYTYNATNQVSLQTSPDGGDYIRNMPMWNVDKQGNFTPKVPDK